VTGLNAHPGRTSHIGAHVKDQFIKGISAT